MSQQFTKDPSATLDYSIDWSKWLADDTILTSEWTVPTGLTQMAASNTTTKATVWLSGGTAGQIYTVTNRISTAGGRTDERSIIIRVAER
jgi:hypothetical protein